MAKELKKFAPLLHELGEDERFILQSTDLDKLLYILIIFTCHMTHHSAPVDPKFYKIRYGLRSKGGQIAESLRRISGMYPKLSWANGKLSMLNSKTYRGQGCLEREEEEKEEEQDLSKKLHPLAEAWNEFSGGLAKVQEVSSGRLNKIRLRIKERPIEEWKTIFKRISASGFCNGKSDRGWKASFDWIIDNDTNAIKVLEGKYDDRKRIESPF